MSLELLGCPALPSMVIAHESGAYYFTRPVNENEIVQTAHALLSKRVGHTVFIANSQVAKDFFMTQLAGLEHEVFCVAFLNNRHQVITCEQMFRGSISSAQVYPREVVKRALECNAAAVIFAHNHPSGYSEPSQNDIALTQELQKLLALFEIRVLDHLVVGGAVVSSFADRGLLKESFS
jgi:DNA repair protein RadC